MKTSFKVYNLLYVHQNLRVSKFKSSAPFNYDAKWVKVLFKLSGCGFVRKIKGKQIIRKVLFIFTDVNHS